MLKACPALAVEAFPRGSHRHNNSVGGFIKDKKNISESSRDRIPLLEKGFSVKDSTLQLKALDFEFKKFTQHLTLVQSKTDAIKSSTNRQQQKSK